jgi:hypothetical protein
MKSWKNLAAALLFGSTLALGTMPAGAAGLLPAQPITTKYEAGFKGTPTRPIVGEVLSGTMRLTFYPNGIVQGTYITQDANILQVSGGLREDGAFWLDIAGTTVTGQAEPGGAIVAYSSGPSFQNLKFVATPTNGGPGP